MIARLNDFSLRNKLYGLLIVAVGAGAIASGILMVRAAQGAKAYDRILGVEVRQEQIARAAQLAFKVQVQEWKNVLLRGHVRADFDKYSAQFAEQEAVVDSIVRDLIAQEDVAPEIRAMAEEFRAAHATMGEAYATAMGHFAETADAHAADAEVRGIDRAPTDLLDALAAELGVQSLSESTGARLAKERTVMIGFLLIVFSAVLVGAWFLVRSITEPLDRVVGVVQRISRGGISGEPLALDRRDEIGSLAASVDRLADDLERNVVGSLTRIAEGDIAFEIEHSEDDELSPRILQVADSLARMHTEVETVIAAARAGRLQTRGDASSFKGAYYEIVAGVNGALDAFLSPVDEANRIMTDLAAGRLRASMDGDYQGDFEVLQTNVNRVGQSLRDAMMRIQGASTGLASNSTQLSSTSDSLSGAAAEAHRQAETATVASTQTSASVQTVASAAEEMSNSIREISQQLHEAVAVAGDARTRVGHTVEIIDYLGAASREIDEVVKVVNSIAEQTNLLALNATIEAARAGEAGKGFAVVASEVKKLASETARATEEIAETIGSIQSRTTDAVTAVNEISQVMDRMNQISEGIASAVEEQSAAVSEIAQSAGQAAQGTEEMTRSIHAVSQAVGNSAESARALAGAAVELRDRSGELQTMVSAYEI